MTDAARTRHGRRAFLRGAGSVAIALPWLEALGCGWLTSDRSGPRRASTVARRSSLDAPPKRFVTLFSGNGTIYDAWRPSGAETAFTLSEILSPLEAHKADIVVLDGLTVESSNHGPGEEHMKGMAGFLTSTELLEGDLFVDSSDLPAGWGGGREPGPSRMPRQFPNSAISSTIRSA